MKNLVRRRETHYIDGMNRKFKVEAVKIKVKPGMSLDDVVDKYLEATVDEDVLKNKAKEIREYLEETRDVDSLERFYKLGQMLQFIDTLNQI